MYISNFIYNTKEGEYKYPDGEGSYIISNQDNVVYVENKPAGNDSTYKHPAMDYPITPVTRAYMIDQNLSCILKEEINIEMGEIGRHVLLECIPDEDVKASQTWESLWRMDVKSVVE